MENLRQMSDNREEIVKVVTTGAMIAILTGLVRALMVQKEAIWVRTRVFFASVSFGILVAIIMRTLEISEFKRECIISVATAFGYSVWPVVEKLVIKWVSKKGEKVDDLLHDNNS